MLFLHALIFSFCINCVGRG